MSAIASPDRDAAGSGRAIAALMGITKLVLHMATCRGYGYFRDELYYLSCADHPAWGYVDHPPLSIALLVVSRWLFGTSLFALRLLPAIAGGLTVYLTCRLARRLGGGPFSQALAGLTAIAAPVYLAIGHYYSMNSIDLLIWTAAFWLLVRLLERPTTRLWLLLGLLLGLGLLNKLSVLWLGIGLLTGMLLTERRRWLLTPGPWLAGGTAAVLFLPHLIWQMRLGWPTLEFMRNATQHKMVAVGPLRFLANQVQVMNPFLAPIWIAGLAWLLLAPRGRPWRLFGWLYLAVALLLMVAGGSRASYLSLAYPILLAAGAAAIEAVSERRGRRWLRPVTVAVVVAAGAVSAPFALPFMPIDRFVAYSRALGVGPSTEERHRMGRLPQQYADMLGWPELAATVAEVYRTIPAETRAGCAIFAQNYGEAGAIDFFGGPLGLPRAISGHNNYWLWGPGETTGDCVIVIGGEIETERSHFEQVLVGATFACADCMPYESDLPIFVARHLRVPVAQAWPGIKHYD
jgi:hypothetical protein